MLMDPRNRQLAKEYADLRHMSSLHMQVRMVHLLAARLRKCIVLGRTQQLSLLL